ncbi:MAG: GlsB/YeaQ/YmgE family stress response membrane protein [Gammaproteobacteria bacterium]
MSVLTWIILGAIAGIIAKWLMPGRDPGGIIITILLGIAGALVGGFIASALGLGGVTGVDIWSVILAVLGAILLLFIYRQMQRRRGARV